MLTLFEEVLTLLVHHDKGTFIGWTVDQMGHALVGAELAELSLEGMIQTSPNNRLQLVSESLSDDNLLDDILAQLKDSEKERKFGYWINHLSQKPERLRKQVMERLIEKGVVIQDDDHLQWLIPSPLEPESNASAKYWVSQRLRGVVLAHDEVGKRDVVLLGLLRACNLLDLVFLKDERRLASNRINEMVVSAAMKDPGFQTIEEILSALATVVEDD